MSPGGYLMVRSKLPDGTWTSGRRRHRDAVAVRYVVQFRAGGRDARLEHGGTFRTRAEADVRRMVIAGELAALRQPELLVPVRPVPPESLDSLYVRYLASRLDLDPKSVRTYAQAQALFGLTGLGRRAVSEITHEHVQACVGAAGAQAPVAAGLPSPP